MNLRPNAGFFKRGLIWCAASILLATAAQLALKWAMLRLPPVCPEGLPEIFKAAAMPALAGLAGGILGYAVSMLCWFLALRSLPLNYAYPMLSLSYVLVCLLAAALPGLNEALGVFKIAGILCVLLGVWLINTPTRQSISRLK